MLNSKSVVKHAFLFVSTCLVAGSFGSLQIDVSELFTPAIAVEPYVYGENVVFQDLTGGKYQFVKRTFSGSQEVIRDNGPAYMYPFDYGGSVVAWIEYKTTYGGIPKRGSQIPGSGPIAPLDGDYYVKAITLPGKTESSLTSNVSYKEFIACGGSRVVWTDYRHFSAGDTTVEVYLRDVSGGGETRLTTASGYKAFVSIAGTRVVWQDYRNNTAGGSRAGIYMKNVSGGQDVSISASGNYYRDQPHIHENIVVWQDYRNAGGGSNADIYMYNLSSRTEAPVCTNSAYQAYPRVYGNYVVWQDYRNATQSNPDRTEIYLFDLSARKEYALTNSTGYKGRPFIYGNAVLWYNYSSEKVHIARINGSTQVRNNRSAAGQPENGTQPRFYDMRGRIMLDTRASGLVLVKENGRIMRETAPGR